MKQNINYNTTHVLPFSTETRLIKCSTEYSDVMEEVIHFFCDNVSHITTPKENETFRSSEQTTGFNKVFVNSI